MKEADFTVSLGPNQESVGLRINHPAASETLKHVAAVESAKPKMHAKLFQTSRNQNPPPLWHTDLKRTTVATAISVFKCHIPPVAILHSQEIPDCQMSTLPRTGRPTGKMSLTCVKWA